MAVKRSVGATFAFIALSCLNFGGQSFAQSAPREFASIGETRYAISPASVSRVGAAVLVRVLSMSGEFGTAQQVLVACDGSWISDSIQLSVSFGDSTTFASVDRKARDDDDPVPLGIVEFYSASSTEQLFAKPLLKHASDLCRTGGKEPRNLLIPVAQSGATLDAGDVVALVTGTAEREGARVDIWTRFSQFKREPMLDREGNPFVFNGVTQKKKVATGAYTLQRYTFDCTRRTMRAYESAEYKIGTATPRTESVPRDGRMSPVIPNSVGEAVLDASCKLY